MEKFDIHLDNKCGLCAERRLIPLYKFSCHLLVRCKQCGFAQVYNLPKKNDLYFLYADTYFKRGKYIEDKAIEKSCKRRVELLRKNDLSDGAKVLDVGCATGDFIKSAKVHFNIWGVDISEYAIEVAKKNNPEVSGNIDCQMIEDYTSSEGYFDAVVLWDVIEHLREPVKVVSRLVDFLKPGGILVISTPNTNALFARLTGKYWPLMTVPEHLSFFSPYALRLLMEKNGFKVLSWKSVGAWSNIGFLMGKISRIFPAFSFLNTLQDKRFKILNKLFLYVPTGDIQYLVAQKL